MKLNFGKTRLFEGFLFSMLCGGLFSVPPRVLAAPTPVVLTPIATALNDTPPVTLAPVDEVATLCEDGQCLPVISQTEYFGRAAYRLTDGKNEAIVVPSIGRIMRFGRVKGLNLLWNIPSSQAMNGDWKNYGGDKNWLAPQSAWPQWNTKGWPPDAAFDGQPQDVEIVSGGKLRLTTPLSAGTGIRFIRTMFFNTRGEFVIEQTAKKEKGAPIQAAIWSITQAVPGKAVFIRANPNSLYEGKFHVQMGNQNEVSQDVALLSPTLLRAIPRTGVENWKIGADSPVSRLVSVHDGVAFLLSTPHAKGQYPNGQAGRGGFPVELFTNANAKTFYQELELIGPLRDFHVGSAWTHTMRWSLHDLPSQDVNSPEVVSAVEKLLNAA